MRGWLRLLVDHGLETDGSQKPRQQCSGFSGGTCERCRPLQETLNSTVSGVTSTAQDTLAAAKQASQDSLDAVRNSLFNSVHSIQDALSSTVDTATKSVSGAGSQLTSQADSFLRPLRDIGRPLQSAIDQASAGVVDTAARVSQEVEGALPAEVRGVIVGARKTAGELSGPLQNALKAVSALERSRTFVRS